MSVSHQLATNDARRRPESDPEQEGRPEQAAIGARGTEQSHQDRGSHPPQSEFLISAPEQLGLQTRIAFREVAATLVDRIPSGAGYLVVDCATLNSIDSAGLNALILVQRRAAARRVRVVLRELDEELLALLVLTKLDDLFEIELGKAR